VQRLAGGYPQPFLSTHGQFLPGTEMANWRHKTCDRRMNCTGSAQTALKACVEYLLTAEIAAQN
jgi:hypothetical protein